MYVMFGGHVFQQGLGVSIPMGTNCASHWIVLLFIWSRLLV